MTPLRALSLLKDERDTLTELERHALSSAEKNRLYKRLVEVNAVILLAEQKLKRRRR